MNRENFKNIDENSANDILWLLWPGTAKFKEKIIFKNFEESFTKFNDILTKLSKIDLFSMYANYNDFSVSLLIMLYNKDKNERFYLFTHKLYDDNNITTQTNKNNDIEYIYSNLCEIKQILQTVPNFKNLNVSHYIKKDYTGKIITERLEGISFNSIFSDMGDLKSNDVWCNIIPSARYIDADENKNSKENCLYLCIKSVNFCKEWNLNGLFITVNEWNRDYWKQFPVEIQEFIIERLKFDREAAIKNVEVAQKKLDNFMSKVFAYNNILLD